MKLEKYPTMWWHADGKFIENYTGKNTADEIKKYVLEKSNQGDSPKGPAPKVDIKTKHIVKVDPSNYKDIVEDPTKDVVFTIYCSDCPGSKKLLAKLDGMAMKLKGTKNLVFAKWNILTHPAPINYEGIPYLTWFARGDKTPVLYPGPDPAFDKKDRFYTWLFLNSKALKEDEKLAFLYKDPSVKGEL